MLRNYWRSTANDCNKAFVLAFLDRGESNIEKSQYAEAIANYSKVIETDPSQGTYNETKLLHIAASLNVLKISTSNIS